MSTAVIELQELEVRFGRRVILDRLNARLGGNSIGLLGPNGAGKTTLIHTLLGFHRPSSGTARLFGHDIRRESRRVRRHIGYMPERDAFIAGMSAVHFVRLMAELSGLPPRAALERAHEALYYVGLGEARYRSLETYSLGMKQQVKLAQAIVHGPRLLLLDEPTNGLDPPHRERMLRLIREIRDDGRVSLVLSSHLLRDVEETCDEVLVLKDGRIASSCDLEQQRRANRRLLEIEAPGAEDELERELVRLGCEVARGRSGRMRTVLPDGVEVADLYRSAERLSLRLRHLSFKKDSLEEIFLRAMEGADGRL
jgi:ABC-2 type transport system ATP-binding protein